MLVDSKYQKKKQTLNKKRNKHNNITYMCLNSIIHIIVKNALLTIAAKVCRMVHVQLKTKLLDEQKSMQ